MDAGRTARAAGITYRQLDHWTRQGWLQPAPRPSEASGSHRDYPAAEVEAATIMGRLVRAGFTASGAARAARRFDPELDVRTASLGGGVFVRVFR